ncbi:MAG: thioesterase family protein [Verrucomicrobiota bacterium]|nr:thioesterase [Verrucomicrobiales bacterium]MED5454147.1 thioesterase family protein [Verrucomicrobiota bacterium]|tara:strand:+ start:117 stop:530 length:414 start_codon:yes stop_codon:yes gene_type:complete
MQSKVHSHFHRVTYGDCTDGNHIYYGRYLYILEEARGEFFRSLGITFRDYYEQGVLFPVSEVCIKYHLHAEYDDELIIESYITKLKGARLGFGYRIKRDSVLILEGETLHGCTDKNGSVKRLPTQLKDSLQLFIADN